MKLIAGDRENENNEIFKLCQNNLNLLPDKVQLKCMLPYTSSAATKGDFVSYYHVHKFLAF